MIDSRVAFTFSPTPLQVEGARDICALHNRSIPAIKEIRAKLSLGLREAKQLHDEVWDTVEHPTHVEYDFLDRRPAVLVLQSLHIDGLNLIIGRSDKALKSIKLSKKTIKELMAFGVKGKNESF